MLTPSEIIKAFWIKYSGDTGAILKAIKDKEDVPDDVEARKKLSKFDAKYESIVVVDEEYSKLNDRLAPLASSGVAATLIRWNRAAAFKDRLFLHYDQTVFILDDDIQSYILPEGLLALGLYADEDGFHLISETRTEVLSTKYFKEVVQFVLAACRYLVVGSKGIGPDSGKIALSMEQRAMLFDAYVAKAMGEPDDRVMVVPGKPGCFSNQCLKDDYPHLQFIDCWNDVILAIDHKKPY